MLLSTLGGFSTVSERVFERKENVMQPRPQCLDIYKPLYVRERKHSTEKSTKLVYPVIQEFKEHIPTQVRGYYKYPSAGPASIHFC